jgi:hypothetical protein
MRRAIVAACVTTPLWLALPGCAEWFFSGEHWIDQTRPVALVETTGGIEFGATTEFGILTLGRTATEGPCRVHYFLGPTPVIETGELVATNSAFTEAQIDLKTQAGRLLDRDPTPDDYLFVMWTPDGERVESVAVALATGDGLGGSLLRDPGVELPAGAGLFASAPDGRPLFAGLVAGRATVEGGSNAGRYYVVAGVDRVRELLAVPQRHPVDLQPKYRTDDITVMEPGAPPPPESERQQTLPGPGVLFPGLLPPTPGTVLPGTTTPSTTDPPK